MIFDDVPDDWDDAQINLFQTLKALLMAAQEQFTHPTCPRLHDQHWQTIAHNASFMAAEIAGGRDEVTIVDSDDQVEFVHVIRSGFVQ